MRDTKRRFELFSFYDRTGIQAHLERMAARGWLLEKMGNFGWLYRRIVPKKLHFAVTYFPKASEFDAGLAEGQDTFQDYCAQAGWQPAAKWAQMQVYYNEAEAPVPIETDAAVQVETVHRAMKKNFLPGQAVMLLLALIQLGMFFRRLHREPVGVLSSYTSLFVGVCWAVVILLCLTELVSYLLWYRRAKAAAQSGAFVETHSHRGLQAAALALLGAGLPLWFGVLARSRQQLAIGVGSLLLMMLLMFLPNFIKARLKRKRVSAGLNRAVTLISCFVLAFALTGGLTFCIFRLDLDHPGEETYTYQGYSYDKDPMALPMTLEDLTGETYEHVSRERSASRTVFLAHSSCQERVQNDSGSGPLSLSYEITDIKQPWLRDLVVRDYLENTGFSVRVHGTVTFDFSWDWLPESSPARWGADAVYRKRWEDGDMRNEYLLFYGDRVVELTLEEAPTPAQTAVIGEKLKTA
nr:DUF2812 domain-containing protein [uncultured Oscillibacter sp.]